MLLKRGAIVDKKADNERCPGYAPLHMVAKYGRLGRKLASKREGSRLKLK
ncbi:unnamed protein product [Cylicostephanus goldi]|uniref:Ankyrin repeat domain-containing protein n=1 Tax=Cylicostephanus goldi TaxID=71465 RepID=A0A3P6TCT7_CYLGO|nr:unnamed protein product [Cylicostephanus goldi]